MGGGIVQRRLNASRRPIRHPPSPDMAPIDGRVDGINQNADLDTRVVAVEHPEVEPINTDLMARLVDVFDNCIGIYSGMCPFGVGQDDTPWQL